MKKKALALVLALVLVLSLVPMTAMAAEAPTEEDLKTPPVISNLEIHDDGEGYVWLEVTVYTPENVLNAIDYFENHELGYNQAGYIGQIDLQYSIDGGEWQETALAVAWKYYEDAEEVPRWNGIHETYYMDELHVDSEVRARARYNGADAEGNSRYSDWSNMLTLNEKVDFVAHQWAIDQGLGDAQAMGLIPDCLLDKDLRENITRAEFAAVCVKLFEYLTTLSAAPAPDTTFSDTKDPEVLKAYEIGITNGYGGTTEFRPDNLISREEAATMLTRVYKKVNLSGWSLEKDGEFAAQFKTLYEMPPLFDDDDVIASWFKDSVYFMAANKIINGVGHLDGVGDNCFAPKVRELTGEQVGNATREAALLISVRTAKNLG